MAIGRKFEEAFQKALRMMDEAVKGFDPSTHKVCEKVTLCHFILNEGVLLSSHEVSSFAFFFFQEEAY